MAHFHNPSILGSSGNQNLQYRISRSLRFNSADSANLSRTPGSAGNQKTWTWSGWVKRSLLGSKYFFGAIFASSNTRYQFIGFDSSDKLVLVGGNYTTGGSTTTNVYLQTSAVYRDTSAWYHIVVAVDTTQATNTNRAKLYVNGVQVTELSTATYPSQNTESYVNSVQPHYVGDWGGGFSLSLDGYMADIYFLDGTATTPSTFAETDAITGQWVPKTPTGISYGTNGFRLPFSDNSGTTSTTLGKDSAGSNNFTPNNFSVASGSGNDSLVDTPTSYGTDTGAGGEVRGNYATLNPLDQISTTLTNGNLDASIAGASTAMIVCGSIAVTTGKWYWEVTATSANLGIGIQQSNVFSTSIFTKGVCYYSFSGQKYVDGSFSNYGNTFTANDVIGIALDLDGGTIQFYKNNTAQGSISLPTSSTGWKPAIGNGTSGASNSVTANFGQRPFAYPVSGFKALCDTNLPAPVVAKPSTVMDVKLYTGNGSSQAITGLGFSPDFLWIKQRSGAQGHALMDAVRGADKRLFSEGTFAEDSVATLTSFDTSGFTVSTAGGASTRTNESSQTYVAWAFDAASSNSTNTSGTITSTVRANATAGFSIVTYTANGTAGATIGHGLGNEPHFIVCKSRSGSTGWLVYHKSLGNTNYLILNVTDASAANAGAWNNTTPTSTVFSIGNGTFVNTNGATQVSYCFAPVAGYSSFGSYTGNGSADGPFVFTGFRPRYLMVKASSAGGSFYYWYVFDSVRDTANPTDLMLFPNVADAESSGYDFDLLANGFKVRTNAIYVNNSAVTYIYAAFAENPFQYARAR